MSENFENNQEKKVEQLLENNPKKEIEQLQQEVKPANKKIIIFNFLLILVIFIGLFIYMIKVDGIDNIKEVLHQVDYKWVVARINLFSYSLDLRSQ